MALRLIPAATSLLMLFKADQQGAAAKTVQPSLYLLISVGAYWSGLSKAGLLWFLSKMSEQIFKEPSCRSWISIFCSSSDSFTKFLVFFSRLIFLFHWTRLAHVLKSSNS